MVLGSAQQAIQGGQSAGSKYPFVLGMIASVGGAYGVCTATLIAPNLALTARHCVSEINTPRGIDCQRTSFTEDSSASDLAVTTDSVLDQGANFYGVRKVLLPTSDDMCGHDIALMILQESIPASEATPIEPLIHESIKLDSRGVRAITAIGYGTVDGQNDSGVRRIRQDIPLICAYDHPSSALDCNGVDADLQATLLTESDFVVSTGVCQGDSGSSAFEQSAFDDGKYYSIGVLSRGSADSCDIGVYTRVDAEKDLIIKAAREAAELGDYPVPGWVEAPYAEPTVPGEEEKGGLGASCTDPAQCESDVCVAFTDNPVCSQECNDDDTPCPDGFTCQGGYCGADPGAVEEDSGSESKGKGKSTETGCSVSADPTKPIPWRSGSSAAALAFGVALLLRRRSSR